MQHLLRCTVTSQALQRCVSSAGLRTHSLNPFSAYIRPTNHVRYFKKKPSKKDKQVEEEEDPPAPAPAPKGKKGKAGAAGAAASGSSGSSALDATIKQIEESFGKGTLIRMGDNASLSPVEVVPTGSLGLDLALGVGGLPTGRITEIYGPESSGKTTLALHIIAEAQKMGKTCTFIDAEHALNSSWAKKIGVNLNDLLISQPDNGEQALEIADQLVKSGNMHLIVIDSVAALVPKNEVNGEVGDSHVGLQARLMSQALRKISPSLSKSNCQIIFINQIRMKIGVMFGNPETTSGGNALKFFASVRLDIRRVGAVKRGDETVGTNVRVKVAKNKVAPPFREALFDIDFTRGISKVGELLDLGVKAKVLDKSGAWYTYNGSQLGNGREKTKLLLEQTPELANEIEKAIRARLLAPIKSNEDDAEEADEAAESSEDPEESTEKEESAKGEDL